MEFGVIIDELWNLRNKVKQQQWTKGNQTYLKDEPKEMKNLPWQIKGKVLDDDNDQVHFANLNFVTLGDWNKWLKKLMDN